MDYDTTYGMYKQSPQLSILSSDYDLLARNFVVWVPTPVESRSKNPPDFQIDHCKIGLLGFIIGLLVIGIILSVLLVLYFRR